MLDVALSLSLGPGLGLPGGGSFTLSWDGAMADTRDAGNVVREALQMSLEAADGERSTAYVAAASLEPIAYRSPSGSDTLLSAMYGSFGMPFYAPLLPLRLAGREFPVGEAIPVSFLGNDLAVERRGEAAFDASATYDLPGSEVGTLRLVWRYELHPGTVLPIKVSEIWPGQPPNVVWEASVVSVAPHPSRSATPQSVVEEWEFPPVHDWGRTPPEEGRQPVFGLGRALGWAADDDAQVARFLAGRETRVESASYSEAYPVSPLPGTTVAATATWRIALVAEGERLSFRVEWTAARRGPLLPAEVHATADVLLETGDATAYAPLPRTPAIAVDHAFQACLDIAEPDGGIEFHYSDVPLPGFAPRGLLGSAPTVGGLTAYQCGGRVSPAFAMDAYTGLLTAWREA